VARWLSVVAAVLMIVLAWWYTTIDMKTFSDTGLVIGGLVTGGVFGIYMLGFFVPLGDGRAMFWGIMAAVVFSLWRAGILIGWWGSPGTVWYFTDNYYTGMLGHAAAFVIGFFAAGIIQLFDKKKRDWTNLTVWTQDGEPLQ
ncbi:MAG: hypothetical protein KAH38_12850, partial [Candidatus Hydrogenedentes bacterium]|nr:hypothetical protein [Candidatus Hydrogenedentota bacterium]